MADQSARQRLSKGRDGTGPSRLDSTPPREQYFCYSNSHEASSSGTVSKGGADCLTIAGQVAGKEIKRRKEGFYVITFLAKHIKGNSENGGSIKRANHRQIQE